MPIHRFVSFTNVIFQCNRRNNIIRKHVQQMNNCRFVTTEPPRQTNLKLKQEKEKFRTFVIQRYMEYVKNYTQVLETRFPAAMRMYRIFSVGIKDFIKDLRTYVSLRIRISKDKSFSNFTRQEIELYLKMPSDMLRIAPVLVLSTIPFGNYLIFPLAFLRPRKMLCSHFWSIQQRAEFSMLDLQERLKYNRPVFRALQAKLDMIPDDAIKNSWTRIIAQLGSGGHADVTDVLACKELFESGPYSLSHISYAHCGNLLKMHGLNKGILRRSKLKYRAHLLREMDAAIEREGGVTSLSSDSLRHTCALRGLHGAHLSSGELRAWLQRWLHVSRRCTRASYSLLLHCPILFAYNHSQNWMLIY